MEAFNSLVSVKFGVVVCHKFPMLSFHLKTEGGIVLVQLATALVTLTLEYGVEPLTLVLLTHRGVMFAPVLHGVVTAMNSCIAGVLVSFRACITPVLTAIAG